MIMGRRLKNILGASVLVLLSHQANAQTVEELQAQIDELKAAIKALQAAQSADPTPSAQPRNLEQAERAAQPDIAPLSPAERSQPTQLAAEDSDDIDDPTAMADGSQATKPWYDRIKIRGYAQLRHNEIVSGDEKAEPGQSRLRSVHDRSVGDEENFFLRRARLVLQGDLSDYISFYFQSDFASGINNQSNGERRENFVQLRDAYVDVHLDKSHRFKLRLGQSKVPFGWENLQSSSNRLTLDRSDGINSAVPGEREVGVIAYYTPVHVQRIWDRLDADGQKLFGNYGALGVGVFNGQGANRSEQNDKTMQVAMATYPFELDGVADFLEGQVLEMGISLLRNRVQPEIRTGGVSEEIFKDSRAGFHVILYPQPFGFQAEWNWGRGPEFDVATGQIVEKNNNGGYIQTMVRIDDFPMGELMPYGRWQRYRGGWRAATNAPRLETDELELGVEWQAVDALELTLAYAHMKRREADERRLGRAEGDVIRTQIQWNY
ncbi:porin [Iodidimonas nitroreducens]|uniref:Porin n=2 Tax=Iodidimonas nitroreducens TaxID=1236968 RepID=A0A5A7NCK4_9PROT|nr:porin [Iodidimonas nitroreducens]GAK33817.1 phosphate-selective porin [alpha proteobacterium Q-1]GER04789.1 porin [Iodidimonas nitroreducens]